MLNEPQIVLHGHLTDRPALAYTKEKGTAVAEFTVAQNPRYYDQAAGEWKDGEAIFLRSKMFGDAAESAAWSLNKGDRVTVVGRLRRRSWQESDGSKRYVDEVMVDDLSASLTRQRVKVAKLARDPE